MTWRARDEAVAAMVACRCARCVQEHGITDGGGLPWSSTHMLLCPECGNKRCPKAEDHRFACTGSNEPGQVGASEAERGYDRGWEDARDVSKQQILRAAGEARVAEARLEALREAARRAAYADLTFEVQDVNEYRAWSAAQDGLARALADDDARADHRPSETVRDATPARDDPHEGVPITAAQPWPTGTWAAALIEDHYDRIAEDNKPALALLDTILEAHAQGTADGAAPLVLAIREAMSLPSRDEATTRLAAALAQIGEKVD